MAYPSVVKASALKKSVFLGIDPENGLGIKIRRMLRLGYHWARYSLAETRPGVSGLVRFVVANHLFTASQVPNELAALGEILATLTPECALEIGTARGGTLFFLTRLASPRATILSVDLPGGKFGGGYGRIRQWCYQRFARRDQRLYLLRGDSHSNAMLELVHATLGGRALDYLFIDGDHSYSGVKSDFEKYGPLVKKGGLIAFHDIADGPPENVGGVPRFWNDVRYQYRHREFIADPRQGGWGIGVLYVD